MNRCTDRKPRLTWLGWTLINGQENAWKELAGWYAVNIEIKLGIFHRLLSACLWCSFLGQTMSADPALFINNWIRVYWQRDKCQLTKCLTILWMSLLWYCISCLLLWYCIPCLLSCGCISYLPTLSVLSIVGSGDPHNIHFVEKTN